MIDFQKMERICTGYDIKMHKEFFEKNWEELRLFEPSNPEHMRQICLMIGEFLMDYKSRREQ